MTQKEAIERLGKWAYPEAEPGFAAEFARAEYLRMLSEQAAQLFVDERLSAAEAALIAVSKVHAIIELLEEK